MPQHFVDFAHFNDQRGHGVLLPENLGHHRDTKPRRATRGNEKLAVCGRARAASESAFASLPCRTACLRTEAIEWRAGLRASVMISSSVEAGGSRTLIPRVQTGSLPIRRRSHTTEAIAVNTTTISQAVAAGFEPAEAIRAALTVRSATSYGLRHNRISLISPSNTDQRALPHHGSNVDLPVQSRPRCRLRLGARMFTCESGEITRGRTTGLSLLFPQCPART